MPVTRKALVSFSLGGRYHEDVWCDVVPMDVSHILIAHLGFVVRQRFLVFIRES